MKNKTIRLTESELRKVISESVQVLLREYAETVETARKYGLMAGRLLVRSHNQETADFERANASKEYRKCLDVINTKAKECGDEELGKRIKAAFWKGVQDYDDLIAARDGYGRMEMQDRARKGSREYLPDPISRGVRRARVNTRMWLRNKLTK